MDGRAEFQEEENRFKEQEPGHRSLEHETANAWMEKQQLMQIR